MPRSRLANSHTFKRATTKLNTEHSISHDAAVREDNGHATEQAWLAKSTQNCQTRTTKSLLCDKHFYTCGAKPHGWQLNEEEDTRQNYKE